MEPMMTVGVIVLLLNVAGIVWAAATVVAQMKETSKDLKEVIMVVRSHDDKLASHETRITVLERIA